MKVVYLVHILEDAAVKRRLGLLHSFTRDIVLMGFFRGHRPPKSVGGIRATSFGRTTNSALLRRVGSVLFGLAKVASLRALYRDADVVIARSLEVAVIGLLAAGGGSKGKFFVYECLDIHGIMLKASIAGRAMRAIEARVLQRADKVIISSPAFAECYFKVYHSDLLIDYLLIENKILPNEQFPAKQLKLELPAEGEDNMRLGWSGIIRCRKSLAILDRVTRQLNGRLTVVIRGKPAHDQIPDFDSILSENPWIDYAGPYVYPEDLQAIYNNVHYSWAIDFYEEGANSSWLLPNRLYESSYFGAVPIAMADVETGRWLSRHGLGVVVDEPVENFLVRFFGSGEAAKSWSGARKAVLEADESFWVCGQQEQENIKKELGL